MTWRYNRTLGIGFSNPGKPSQIMTDLDGVTIEVGPAIQQPSFIPAARSAAA